MINNLYQGIVEDIPCDCVHNNVANGSFTSAADIKYADLITCGKCNFKWYSNKEGIFDYGACPRCKSTSPIAADLNQKRLSQGSSEDRRQAKIKELQRIINLKFEVGIE